MVITVVVNPKEYLEKYKNKDVNKKNKSVQKEDTAGVYFEDYSRRILSLHDHEAINTNVNQKRLQIKNRKMNMKQLRKSQFARLDDKRY